MGDGGETHDEIVTDDEPDDDAPAWARRLREEIAGVREFFVGGAGGDGAGDDAGGDGADDTTGVADDGNDVTAPAGSARQAEVDTERAVRDALARVRREEQTDERVSKLEGEVAAVKERPPIKQSRLSRALWGDANKVTR